MKNLRVAVAFLMPWMAASAFAATSVNPPNPDNLPNVMQGPAAAPAYSSPPQPGTRQAQGMIDQIDPVKEVVRLRDAAGHEDAFFVETNTPIYDSLSRPLSFKDLRPGDLVSITFSPVDNTVHQIQKLKG